MSEQHDTTPPDPRADRFDALMGALRADRLVVALLAALAMVVPWESVATGLGAAALMAVTASAPLRVGWLAQRWLAKRDRLFGSLAVALFLLPLLGFGLSLVT